MNSKKRILILNLGSTSVKGAIFEWDVHNLKCIFSFSKKLSEILDIKGFILNLTENLEDFDAIAFRVVHGGKNYQKPEVITFEILNRIKEAEILAPLHNSIFIQWYQEIKLFTNNKILLIACFDSAFFYDLPEISKMYPIAVTLTKKFGLQKRGFHGFAHKSMLAKLENNSKGKIITMQLGGGCSITATLDGKPIETSMGFTPLEGLMMGTRSGSIDPGIIFYLLKKGVKSDDLEKLLNHDSGFKGLAGTDDLKKILEMKTKESQLALDLFCRNIAKYIGSYIVLLGGVDILVFGGGIGENSSLIRSKVMTYLNYSDIYIDENLNKLINVNCQKISAINSKAEIYIIKPDEEFEMAKEVHELLINK